MRSSSQAIFVFEPHYAEEQSPKCKEDYTLQATLSGVETLICRVWRKMKLFSFFLLSCAAMTTIWAQVTLPNDKNNKTVLNTGGHNVVKVSTGSTHTHVG